MLMKELPFFVYGTLRHGQGNYRLLVGRTVSEQVAVLDGHAMVDMGVPFVAPDPTGAVVSGELMVVAPDRYAEVRAALDALEGFRPERPERSMYVRTECTVHVVGGGPARAWVYLAGVRAVRDLAYGTPVPSGDWVRWQRSDRAA